MDRDARYAVVGSFVIIVILAFLTVFAWLIHSFEREQVTRYNVEFTGTIAGLQEGSAVSYRGVSVGRVIAINLDPDQVGRIIVTIAVDPATPIRQDTIGAIAPLGITGAATIELEGGDADSPMAVVADGGLPTIAGQKSTLEQVFDSTPDLLREAVIISGKLVALLTDENIVVLKSILHNTDRITTVLGHEKTGLAPFLVQANATAREIETLVQTTNATIESSRSQLDELVNNGIQSLEVMQETAKSVQSSTRRVDNLIAGVQDPLIDFSNGGLYELSKLVTEMRQLTAAMSRIALEFERDPAGYLLGGSDRGFVPQ